MFLLIAFVALAAVFLFLFLLYKAGELLRKKGYTTAAILLPVLVIFAVGYFIYVAVFPSDDFYRDEFKTELNIPFPKSGHILNKDADFPDTHGDYQACFSMRVGEKEYSELAAKFPGNSNADSMISGDSYSKVMRHYDQKSIAFMHTEKLKEDHFVYLVFLNDRKTIIFNRVSW